MNIKRPIDLRIPHLIPERIRQYAFDIFDIENPDNIDPTLQLFFLFLWAAEYLLSKDPLSSFFFEKTRQNPEHLNALKELSKQNPEWRKFRSSIQYSNDSVSIRAWKFPFFATYFYDNHCTSIKETLLTLLKDHPLLYLLSNSPDMDPNFVLPEHLMPKEDSQRSGRYEVPLYSSEKCFSPYQSYILQNFNDRYSLRPVFVVEGIIMAKNLETEICKGEYVYLLEELKNFYDAKTPAMRCDEFVKINSRREYFDVFKRPFGDAVVTAPVGRFHIPEFTDWNALANRDIYIFKFKERDTEKAINQLLRVGAAIVRDAGKAAAERMHFVIMTEKRGPKVSENDILYLTTFELFSKAESYSCAIPQGFMEVYEEYHRRSGPQHYNRYIVEPFLRRNSWMLISGEEGSGKSYLAMILGAALAAGGKLFLDWKIRRRKTKVLYIVDDEMTDDILDERKSVLNRLYPGNHDLFFIKSVHRMDLLNGGKNEIENLLIEYGTRGNADSGAVEVLILDHLLKLTANHGDEEQQWIQVRDWIENDICKRGITVILLHHEYSGARMMGSKIIANDAPARIHLSHVDSPEDRINFSISVVKNRGGRTYREERAVSLNLKGRPRFIEHQEEVTESAEKRPFRKISRDERRKLVTEWQKTMTVSEMCQKLGCSKSSVEKIITDIRHQ